MRFVFVLGFVVVVVLLLFLFEPDITGGKAVAVAAEDEDSGLLGFVGPIAVREGRAEDEDAGRLVGPIAVREGCLLRRLLDCWRRALRRGERVEVVGVESEALFWFTGGEKKEAGGGAVVVAGESIVEMLRLDVVEVSS